MARRKKSDSGGGANWMDTYGDMVTLLLCFFVLLYSMSTIDQLKWEILVKSFNPDAEAQSQIVVNQQENEAPEDVPGTVEPPEVQDFDDLYYQLKEYVEQNSLDADIEISKGDGFTFITFKNNIFFDGDSYVLKPEGKEVLDHLAEAVYTVKDTVKEIEIFGHTSQAKPNEPNEVVSDRFLSSNRATVVLVYLQQKNLIDPARLISTGFGQFRPISPFDTTESRAKNRRVEILITKNDTLVRSLDEYYKEAYGELPEIP